MSAPSGTATQPSPVNDPSAHLAGAKALLAKKMAQKECVLIKHSENNPTLNLILRSNPITVSPTDNMMTPTSAKINQVKKKHFTKYVYLGS
jgi:hypothetical protein